jgi:hypothetical protein
MFHLKNIAYLFCKKQRKYVFENYLKYQSLDIENFKKSMLLIIIAKTFLLIIHRTESFESL